MICLVSGLRLTFVCFSFEDSDLHEKCLSNIQRAKYSRPTPIQKWAIPSILSGRDIMGCAQTGSGKTAAFLLPIISSMLNSGIEGSAFSEIQEPACLVVGPTRELVLQIRDEARKFSYDTMLRPVVVYGGTAVYHQLNDLGKGAHIVVGTPGRLMDFIGKGKVRWDAVVHKSLPSFMSHQILFSGRHI